MVRTRALLAVVLGLAVLGVPDAQGAAGAHARERTVRAALRIGRSMGSPTDGRLMGGAHLDEAPYLRIVPNDAGGDVRWGIEPLVGLVEHSARAVRHQFPDAVMSVGHLSRAGGGEIDRHASHESGRDADVGFYIRSQTGHPLYAEHFVPFRGDGTASSWPGAYFDDARNWALVAALVSDPRARVTHIFVAAPLRTRLLAYAERTGAPMSERVRGAELMAQPKGSLPHDDHFHVRIGCPSGMTGCIEQPTKPHAHHRAMARAHAIPERLRTKPIGPRGEPSHDGDTPGRPPATEPDPHDGAKPSDEMQAPAPGENAPPVLLDEPVEDADGPLSMRDRADETSGSRREPDDGTVLVR
jgi:penicillin-insensitive murein endopeptidase